MLKDISYPQPYSQLLTSMTLRRRLHHGKWSLSTITIQLKMASRQAHKRHTEQTHILCMGISSSIIQASGVTYNIQFNYNYMLTEPRLLDAYKCCLSSPELEHSAAQNGYSWSYNFSQYTPALRKFINSIHRHQPQHDRQHQGSLSRTLSYVIPAATRQI